MLRFQKGETAAFDELVQRNTGKVHALVYRFLGDPGAVDDLTQEVFLRVFRTAPRYQPTAKFSTWLYRITANLAFNVLRERRKSRTIHLDTTGSDDSKAFFRNIPDDRAAAPHHALDTAELQQKIADAICALPEAQRIAIVLNKYENKNYEEIASILDCSTMAVKSLLSRARGNLRDALARYLRWGIH